MTGPVYDLSMRPCVMCQTELSLLVRSHARTCSARCRKALSRLENKAQLPEELTTRDRWVRWAIRSGTKVPLTVVGLPASSTNPATWNTLNMVRHAPTIGQGIGFVLTEDDDIVCLDLDHCLNPLTGRLAPWAAAIVRDAGATYVEVSPSGDGLHIWGYATVRQGRRIRRLDGTAVEIYGTGRYITVTGRRHGSCPSTLADLSALIADLT